MANVCCSSFSTTTPWTDCANVCIANASPGFTGIGSDGSAWIYLGGDVCVSGSWEVISNSVLAAAIRPFQVVGFPIEATSSDDVPNIAAIFHTGQVVIGDIIDSTFTSLAVRDSVAFGANDHDFTLGTNASILSGATNRAAGNNSVAIGARNIVSNLSGFVSGEDNTVDADISAIIAGNNNTVSGANSAIIAGTNNIIQISGTESVILGGDDNDLGGYNNAILCGHGNTINPGVGEGDAIIASALSSITATGGHNVIMNGLFSSIAGANVGYSYAGGNDAHALHDYTYIHATSVPFSTITPYEFAVNAIGGFRFFNDGTQVAGWTSPTGNVGIIATSSKKIKEGFENVDITGIAKRFANLELNKYKVIKPKFEDTKLNEIKDNEKRKIAKERYDQVVYQQQYGIMAESFNEIFGDMFDVKKNDGYDALSVFDVLGVLAAAIKDLSAEVEALKQPA